MGFELDAFLGKTSKLQAWRERLPSAVVCELSGDLSLVPMASKFSGELRARLGEGNYEERVRRWGKEASAGTVVAFVSVGEFGSQSHERATLWSNGREVLSQVALAKVLAHFRDRAGLDLGDRAIDAALEQFRGEDAAEKWAAAFSQAAERK